MLLASIALASSAFSAHASASPAYVVAVAKSVADDAEWRRVVDALVTKHGGASAVPVVTFDAAHPESLVEPLSTLHPRHLAIVVPPAEAGRAFVGGVHRAARRLDDDPYGDVRWGIVTAASADGALRLASHAEPLVMRRAAGTADFPMRLFDSSVWWSEEAAWSFTLHSSDAPNRTLDEKSIGPAVAAALNERPVDLVLSGGHATERGLELGFRKPAGRIGPKDGRTVVECADHSVIPLASPSPKAWIGVGNCLIGNVNGPSSAACSFVDDFGVRAHVGYVVVTWFGRGGWGTLSWFTDQPGRYTLNDAWFLNNQMIVDELVRRWPQLADLKLADATFDGWIDDDPDRFGAAVARAVAGRVPQSELKDLVGLLWDRDAVSYIGDPAWDARLATRDAGWTSRDDSSSGELRIEVRADADAHGVPPAFFPRQRIINPTLVAGAEFDPLVTDDFCIVRKASDLTNGATVDVRIAAGKERGASGAP
ncbi:MAG: hypothetical protein U0572_13540 [Phycisphaerales bacterium]